MTLEDRAKQPPEAVVMCVTADYGSGERSAESLCSWILNNMAEDSTRSDLELYIDVSEIAEC